MPDTARDNTYRDKKKRGLDDVSYSNPLYNTSAVLKGVGDKLKAAFGRTPPKKKK